MKTTLYLIRHGITRANQENRFAGRTPEPLHPEGVGRIGEVAVRLNGAGISRVVHGPLPRARQTAEIIGGLLEVPVETEEGLNEIFIPHWDGLTKDEIRTRYGDQYPTWLAAPETFRVPGCETIAEVQERAVQAVEGLLAAHAGETVLAVSHLIPIRALLLYYQGLPISDFRSITVANGEIVALTRTGDGSTRLAACR